MGEQKTINWVEQFSSLFPEQTIRTLQDNHVWCDSCNGLGWIRQGQYIKICQGCSGKGQIELCVNGCGAPKDAPYSVCKPCKAKSAREHEAERISERNAKAKRVKYADYEGMFIINDTVVESNDFEDWLYTEIKEADEEEDYPSYVYGTQTDWILSLDLVDELSSRCDHNGYEEMSERVDFGGLELLQKGIDDWLADKGTSIYTYCEDYSVIVELDELIESIKKDIIKERERYGAL